MLVGILLALRFKRGSFRGFILGRTVHDIYITRFETNIIFLTQSFMPPKKKHLPKMLVHKYVEEKIEESDATKKAKHTFDGATSIYSCTTHADKFLKFDGSNKNIAHCKSCGSKIFGQHGFLTCTTAGCFFLCSSCKVWNSLK